MRGGSGNKGAVATEDSMRNHEPRNVPVVFGVAVVTQHRELFHSGETLHRRGWLTPPAPGVAYREQGRNLVFAHQRADQL